MLKGQILILMKFIFTETIIMKHPYGMSELGNEVVVRPGEWIPDVQYILVYTYYFAVYHIVLIRYQVV